MLSNFSDTLVKLVCFILPFRLMELSYLFGRVIECPRCGAIPRTMRDFPLHWSMFHSHRTIPAELAAVVADGRRLDVFMEGALFVVACFLLLTRTLMQRIRTSNHHPQCVARAQRLAHRVFQFHHPSKPRPEFRPHHRSHPHCVSQNECIPA